MGQMTNMSKFPILMSTNLQEEQEMQVIITEQSKQQTLLGVV